MFEADRRRYLVGHALVRTTLSRYAACPPQRWTFSGNAYGRPEIAGPGDAPGLRFSLSYTRGLTAVAIARAADVGIDVERFEPRPDLLDIARRFSAVSEAEALGALPDDRQLKTFYHYWTPSPRAARGKTTSWG